MKDNVEAMTDIFIDRYVHPDDKHNATVSIKGITKATHNAAIDEALSLLPEEKREDAYTGRDEAYAHNTAVALMRERLLAAKK